MQYKEPEELVFIEEDLDNEHEELQFQMKIQVLASHIKRLRDQKLRVTATTLYGMPTE